MPNLETLEDCDAALTMSANKKAWIFVGILVAGVTGIVGVMVGAILLLLMLPTTIQIMIMFAYPVVVILGVIIFVIKSLHHLFLKIIEGK